jgi:hypothetical protein
MRFSKEMANVKSAKIMRGVKKTSQSVGLIFVNRMSFYSLMANVWSTAQTNYSWSWKVKLKRTDVLMWLEIP